MPDPGLVAASSGPSVTRKPQLHVPALPGEGPRAGLRQGLREHEARRRLRQRGPKEEESGFLGLLQPCRLQIHRVHGGEAVTPGTPLGAVEVPLGSRCRCPWVPAAPSSRAARDFPSHRPDQSWHGLKPTGFYPLRCCSPPRDLRGAVLSAPPPPGAADVGWCGAAPHPAAGKCSLPRPRRALHLYLKAGFLVS